MASVLGVWGIDSPIQISYFLFEALTSGRRVSQPRLDQRSKLNIIYCGKKFEEDWQKIMRPFGGCGHTIIFNVGALSYIPPNYEVDVPSPVRQYQAMQGRPN